MATCSYTGKGSGQAEACATISSSSSSSSSGSSIEMGVPKRSHRMELPIIIDGREKFVTGLTSRTTCDDVIYALLPPESRQMSDISRYAIFENWAGVERPLRGRTKILKVWRAWGTENQNVTFTLRKISPIMPSIGRRHKKMRHHLQKNGYGRKKQASDNAVPHSAGNQDGCVSQGQSIPDMVSTLLEQEKQAQDQRGRLQDVERQIEMYETKVHLSRMKENGANYVQEAYLRERGEDSASSGNEVDYRTEEIKYLEVKSAMLDMVECVVKENRRITELSALIREERTVEDEKEGSHTLVKRLQEEVQQCIAVRDEQAKFLHQIQETLSECESQLTGKKDYVLQLESELKIRKESAHCFESETMTSLPESHMIKNGIKKPLCSSYNVSSFNDVKIPQHQTLNTGFSQEDRIEKLKQQYKHSIDNPDCSSAKNDSTITLPPDVPGDWPGVGDPGRGDVLCGYKPYITYTCYRGPSSDSDSTDTGVGSLGSDEGGPVLETLV